MSCLPCRNWSNVIIIVTCNITQLFVPPSRATLMISIAMTGSYCVQAVPALCDVCSPDVYLTVSHLTRSSEWARPGGCKPDKITYTINGHSVLAPSGSVTVCQALKLGYTVPESKPPRPLSPNVLIGWRTIYPGPSAYPRDPHGPHAVYDGVVMRNFASQPEAWSRVEKGKRYDFVLSLEDGGDGKAPTMWYISKHGVVVERR
jgi:hypothetical protein